MIEMELLYEAPVIIKVLSSLTVILIINSFCRQLLISLVCGTLLLAVWSGHSLPTMTTIAFARLTSANNLFLMAIIFQVIWLSSQMSASGVMRDLVVSVQSRISQRAAMAMLPVIIGSLPMPGGALFSAPLVDDCDRDKAVPAVLKTQINYWFRHIWEYWWPLYPGVLLALDITKLDVWQLALLQFPLTLIVLAAGYWFLLKQIVVDKAKTSSLTKVVNWKFIGLISPIIVVIAVYAMVRTTLPMVAQANKYLPMIIGIFSAMLFLQKQRPLNLKQWKKIVLSKRVVITALLVALVRIYGAFIEAPLPSGTSLVGEMRLELAHWHIPVAAIIMVLPFISGLASGLAIGFVGASFPIVFSLLGASPPLSTVLATTVLAYGFGYMGMMLSPVHICLIVSNQHFDTQIHHSLAGLIRPALVVLAGTVILHIIVKLALSPYC